MRLRRTVEDWPCLLEITAVEAGEEQNKSRDMTKYREYLHNQVRELMTNYGKPPVLIESIRAEIAIETDVSGLTVWAISPEGFYIGTVPSTYEDGKLTFKVGETSKSMYYLIVKD